MALYAFPFDAFLLSREVDGTRRVENKNTHTHIPHTVMKYGPWPWSMQKHWDGWRVMASGQCVAIRIHTGIELRVMLINLTAISTGFWIREDRKRKGKEQVRVHTPSADSGSGWAWRWKLLESTKEPQAILCCKRGGEALAAVTDGTPQERVPSRPHSLSRFQQCFPWPPIVRSAKPQPPWTPAGLRGGKLRPFLSRATAFQVSGLAKKHANCSVSDKKFISGRGSDLLQRAEQGPECSLHTVLSPQSLPLARAGGREENGSLFLKQMRILRELGEQGLIIEKSQLRTS